MKKESENIETEISKELKKPFWKSFFEAIQKPYQFLTTLSSQNPLLAILAIVFLLQPVVLTGFDFISTIHQTIHPMERPITRKEFSLLEKRVDFLQFLIVQDMRNDIAQHMPGSEKKAEQIKKLQHEEKELDLLSKKLDHKYDDK